MSARGRGGGSRGGGSRGGGSRGGGAGRGGGSHMSRGNGESDAPSRITFDTIEAVTLAAMERVAGTMRDSVQGDAAAFDNSLHLVMISARPTSEQECAEYVCRVESLICAAGDNIESWKALVLALVRRRYHARAPAAAAAGAVDEDEGTGDGERLLFYLAVLTMQAASLAGHALAGRGAALLSRIAPLAGGTRDICALIELLCMQAVAAERRSGQLAAPLAARDESGKGKAKRKRDESALPPGAHVLPVLISALPSFLLNEHRRQALQVSHAPLFSLVSAAAEMLDADVQLVRGDAAAAQQATDKREVRQY